MLGLYFGAYVMLSVQGTYVPLAWGVSWVKVYAWAPRGFASGPAGTEWHPVLVYSFLPLWGLDRHLWHTEDRMDEGKYPVNRKLDEAFEKERQQNQAAQSTARKLADPGR